MLEIIIPLSTVLIYIFTRSISIAQLNSDACMTRFFTQSRNLNTPTQVFYLNTFVKKVILRSASLHSPLLIDKINDV